MMNRREAIKQVTMMLGGVAFTSSSGLLSAVERAHARAATSRAQVGTFSAQDIALLDEGADTILPETKTPGAKAAHVGPFMALMVTDTYEDPDQTIFRDGIRKLNEASFMAAPPPQRLALLEKLDRAQMACMAPRARGQPPPSFPLVKHRTRLCC